MKSARTIEHDKILAQAFIHEKVLVLSNKLPFMKIFLYSTIKQASIHEKMLVQYY